MFIQSEMDKIVFGTDGWRAIIAGDFSFKNLQRIAQAYADYLNASGKADKGVAVSFDTRFMSGRFATAFAEVLASNRVHTILSTLFTPTPVLSFTVKKRNLAGGIMITASHNPYYYNGIKFKDAYGGPALPEMTRSIEEHLDETEPRHDPPLVRKYLLKDDFIPDYSSFLDSYINMPTMSGYPGRVIINPMGGAACGIFEAILNRTGCAFSTINGRPDPYFNNRHPEPVLNNLEDLVTAVRDSDASLGFATDGDADRFGVIDRHGQFVELHDLIPMLARHLIESRGWKGGIVRTTSMADTIDRLAAKYSLPVHEVPVGFKNVTELMIAKDILIGGEESGGFGFKGYIPERDGILSALLTLEMLAAGNQGIDERVQALRSEFGPFAYGRMDQYHERKVLDSNMDMIRRKPPDKIGHFKVHRFNIVDGIKFYFDDRSWMLVRVSQTEPLVRIYVGSTNRQSVNLLLKDGIKLITR